MSVARVAQESPEICKSFLVLFFKKERLTVPPSYIEVRRAAGMVADGAALIRPTLLEEESGSFLKKRTKKLLSVSANRMPPF
jgi:hypothetical protein